MYPRTLLLGSWDITQPYHHPYIHNCMQIHSYGYRYIHVHADARSKLHPDWLRMHMFVSVSIRVYLHAVVCICTFTEDPLDACHPTAPVIIQQSRDSRGTNKQMVYDESHHPLIGVMYYYYFIIKRRMMLLDWGVVCLQKPVSYQYWKGGENKGNWMKQDDHWWSSNTLAASPPPISTLSFVLLSFTTMRPMPVSLSHHYHRHLLALAHRLHQRAVFLPDQHCISLLQHRAPQLLHVRDSMHIIPLPRYNSLVFLHKQCSNEINEISVQRKQLLLLLFTVLGCECRQWQRNTKWLWKSGKGVSYDSNHHSSITIIL